MPRQAKLDAPGTLHHVMIRGIEGKSVFRDIQDRKEFVTRLGNLTKETGTRVLAWSLLRNQDIWGQTFKIQLAVPPRLLEQQAGRYFWGQIFNIGYRHWAKKMPRFKGSFVKNKDLTPIPPPFRSLI
jgi:hypothetical protein